MSENICLVSCLLPFEGPMRQCWIDLSRELDANGSRLVMLSAHASSGLPFQVISVPFFFKDYASCFPGAMTSPPPSLTTEEIQLANCDRLWLPPGYPAADAIAGFSACRFVARTIIETLKPGKVLLWDAVNPSTAIFQQVCWQQGIPVQSIERGLLPGTLMIDSRAPRAYSDLRTHWLAQDIHAEPDCAETFGRARDYYLKNRPQKYQQPGFGGGGHELKTRLGFDKKDVLLFLGQQEQGAVEPYTSPIASRYNSPVFTSNEQTATALGEALRTLPNKVLVIKPHPSDKSSYAEAIRNGATLINDVNVHALIEMADVIAVQSTTLQFEAAFYDKPCLLLGRSAWWGKNAAYEVEDPASLSGKMGAAFNHENFAEKQKNAQAFIAWMLNHFLIGCQPGVPTKKNLRHLAGYLARISATNSDLSSCAERVAQTRKALESLGRVEPAHAGAKDCLDEVRAFARPDDKPKATAPVTDSAQTIRPKILFVSHEASRTGAPIYLLHLLRWLRSHTDLQFMVLLGRSGPLESEFHAVAETFTPETFGTDGSRLAGVELIYSNTCTNGALIDSIPRGNIPVVTHVHELDCIIEMFGRENFDRVRNHTSHFVACSQAVADALTERHQVSADQISVHYEMISVAELTIRAATESRSEVRARYGLSDEAIVIAACGTADWRKGPDLFLQAAAALHRQFAGRKELHFIWIGLLPDDDRGRTMRHDCIRLGLTQCMQFVGEQKNPHALLNACDLFCLTSREDPFPLVMLEAGALGKPLVCFEGSGGAKEFAAKGAGFAVPYLDVPAMVAQCARLIDDLPLRQNTSADAARIVKEAFDVPVAAPLIWRRLQDILRQCEQQAAQIGLLRKACDSSMQGGDWPAALKQMEQLIQFVPDDVEALLTLGNIRYQLGDLDGGAREFERACRQAPRRADAHTQLAMLRVQQNRLVDAAMSAFTALELDPQNLDALRMLAAISRHENRFLRAHGYYASILRLAPQDIDALMGQAECSAALGQLILTGTLLDQILALQPDHPEALALRAQLPAGHPIESAAAHA